MQKPKLKKKHIPLVVYVQIVLNLQIFHPSLAPVQPASTQLMFSPLWCKGSHQAHSRLILGLWQAVMMEKHLSLSCALPGVMALRCNQHYIDWLIGSIFCYLALTMVICGFVMYSGCCILVPWLLMLFYVELFYPSWSVMYNSIKWCL